MNNTRRGFISTLMAALCIPNTHEKPALMAIEKAPELIAEESRSIEEMLDAEATLRAAFNRGFADSRRGITIGVGA